MLSFKHILLNAFWQIGLPECLKRPLEGPKSGPEVKVFKYQWGKAQVMGQFGPNGLSGKVKAIAYGEARSAQGTFLKALVGSKKVPTLRCTSSLR